MEKKQKIKIYEKKLQKQYKKQLQKIHVQVNKPFVIQIQWIPSSGCTQSWYLPPEIQLLGRKCAETKNQETTYGGSFKDDCVFIAKTLGKFCILGENRQQWKIANEAMLPDRYIIHVDEKEGVK